MVCRRATQRRGLSEAKRSAYHYFAHTADLSALGECDDVRIKKLLCINCQGLFFTLNLALTKYPGYRKRRRHTSRGLSEAERSAYQDFAPTADLSAFVGYSAIPINLLNRIMKWMAWYIKVHSSKRGLKYTWTFQAATR